MTAKTASTEMIARVRRSKSKMIESTADRLEREAHKMLKEADRWREVEREVDTPEKAKRYCEKNADRCDACLYRVGWDDCELSLKYNREGAPCTW